MGAYREYLEAKLDPRQLAAERARQLARLAALRGREVLTMAAAPAAGRGGGSLTVRDRVAVDDLLLDLEGDSLDLVLESPGGPVSPAEPLLETLHGQVRDLTVLVTGSARGAGTVLALSGRELVLGPLGSLGPLLPGHSDPAPEVTRELARQLAHAALSRSGLVQANRDAGEVAGELTRAERWLTSDRHLSASDLLDLGIQVEVPAPDSELADVLRRLAALHELTWAQGISRLIESPTARIQRVQPAPAAANLPLLRLAPQAGGAARGAGGAPTPTRVGSGGAATGTGTGNGEEDPTAAAGNLGNIALIEVKCTCGTTSKIQANLGEPAALQEGHWAFPSDDQFYCPNCMTRRDLSEVRRQIEEQTSKKVVS